MTQTNWRIDVFNKDGLVVEDLDHVEIHMSRRGYQAGAAGSTMLASGTLTLRSPNAVQALLDSPDADDNALGTDIQAQYDLLDFEQRVEVYRRGDRNPLETFKLRTPTQTPDEYTWELVDWLDGLASGKTEKQDKFDGLSSDLFPYFLKDWEMVYGDDFSSGDLLIPDTGDPYTETHYGGGTGGPDIPDPNDRHWAPATRDGMTGAELTNLTQSLRYFLHTGDLTWTNEEFIDAKLTADFIITSVPNGTLTTAGLLFGLEYETLDITMEYGVDVRAGAGEWATAHLRFGNAGVVLYPGGTDIIAPALNTDTDDGLIDGDGVATIKFQLLIYSKPTGIHARVNGTELDGASWLDGAAFGANGSIGFYAINANENPDDGGTVFVSNIYFDRRLPVCQPGDVTATTQSHHQEFDATSLLDALGVLAGTEGYDLRKVPKRGWAADLLDFGPGLGTATGIVFAQPTQGSWGAAVAYVLNDTVTYEGDVWRALSNHTGHAPDTSPTYWAKCGGILTGSPRNERNQQRFSTRLLVAGKGYGQSPETYDARDVTAVKRWGLVTRTETQPDIAGLPALRRVAQDMAVLAGQPDVGRTVQVSLDAVGGEVALSPLDTIILHAPDLGYDMSEHRVLGIDLQEGSPVATLTLDQYPDTGLHAFEQMQALIQKVAHGALAWTASNDRPGVHQSQTGIVVKR